MSNPSLLRFALIADAVSGAAICVLLIAGPGFVGEWLNLPRDLLFYAGLVMIPFVALLAYILTRTEPPRGAVMAIVDLNMIWALASFGLLFSGWVQPNTLGTVIVAGQAVAVALLGAVQFVALGHRTAQTSP